MKAFTDLFSGHAKLYAAARPTNPDVVIDELAALAPGRALATAWPDAQRRHVTMPITTRAARL